MPSFIKKFMAGNTSGQIAARNKRFQKRKSNIETVLGGAAVQMEFQSLDEMLGAINAEGGPIVVKMPVVNGYILDWRRKANHGGTQSWYALCDLGNVCKTVVWTTTDSDKKGKIVHGGKVYNMETTAVEDIAQQLNF